MQRFDWTECALIETVPGKRGGNPVVKGTRLRPEDLLVNGEQGIEWLVENHGGNHAGYGPRRVRFLRQAQESAGASPGLRALLDHSVPCGLRTLLAGVEVRHAFEMGWHELRNGDL